MRLLLLNLVTDADSVAQGFTTVWINALAQRCEQIDVISMRTGRIAVAENVRVFSVGKERGYSEPRRLVEFYRILTRLLREGTYDAAFAHMNTLFAILAAPLLKPRRIPLTLWYAHGAVTARLRLAEKLTHHCVSSSLAGFRLPSRKLRIIGQGIDTTHFVPRSGPHPADQPLTIISVSRLAPVKRIEDIITAAGLLRQIEGFPPFQVRIYGDAAPEEAAYKRSLEAQLATSDVRDVVTLAGAVAYEDIVPVYQQADILVNTSQTGSLDKAILEAMACGLPVITSNEAFREMLQDWHEKLLIPPDSPEKLAERLWRVGSIPAPQRAELGAALREIVVRDHSLAHLTDGLMHILSLKP